MGMFDYLRCDMPLPKAWETREGEWQTKSLGCELDTYTITVEGRLVRKAGGWGHGDVPEMEIPYHGDISFYDYDRKRGWIEFVARFAEGRCVRISFETWEPPHDKSNVEPPADSPSPTPET